MQQHQTTKFYLLDILRATYLFHLQSFVTKNLKSFSILNFSLSLLTQKANTSKSFRMC